MPRSVSASWIWTEQRMRRKPRYAVHLCLCRFEAHVNVRHLARRSSVPLRPFERLDETPKRAWGCDMTCGNLISRAERAELSSVSMAEALSTLVLTTFSIPTSYCYTRQPFNQHKKTCNPLGKFRTALVCGSVPCAR